MIQKVESFQALVPVEVAALPNGGTDIWLRAGITTETKTDMDGGELTVNVATEAFLRTSETITVKGATARFNTLWEAAEAYNPATFKPYTDSLEQVRADVDFIAMEMAVTI
ncbi:MAG: hypothetical protein RR301_12595 [Clostridia bacterium]